jgi:hypothetical protein
MTISMCKRRHHQHHLPKLDADDGVIRRKEFELLKPFRIFAIPANAGITQSQLPLLGGHCPPSSVVQSVLGSPNSAPVGQYTITMIGKPFTKHEVESKVV